MKLPTAEVPDDKRQYISFTIGAEEYGVDIMAVREIRAWVETTPLPNAPEYVRGVINLRGIIVPIFDLRARFGFGTTETSKTHVVIVVRVQSRTIGVLVDAISDILTVGHGEIAPVPDLERTVDDTFLEGLLTVQERMVAILNLEKLFDAKSLSKGEEAASRAEAGAS